MSTHDQTLTLSHIRRTFRLSVFSLLCDRRRYYSSSESIVCLDQNTAKKQKQRMQM